MKILSNNSIKAVFMVLAGMLFLSSFGGELRIGAAAVRITPPLGTPMAGYYYTRGAEGVHDDLYAKALVIEKEGVRVAVVSCDIIEIPADLAAEVRRLAEKASGIPAGHIMIGATHAHTGPVILSPVNMYTMDAASGNLLKKYMEQLPVLIAQSIRQACDALKPANLSYGLGQEETISFNRRFFMKDGSVGWNPGVGNPDILRPAGPIDPDVGILYAEALDGQPISTYVNFAVHLDIVSGLQFSADMPFTLSTILGQVKGDDMVTLFAPGCSGNLNHINVRGPEPQGGHPFASRMGTILAGEVIKTYANSKPLQVDKILTKSEVVKLPLYEINPDDLPKAREMAAKFGEADVPFLAMVNAFRVIDVYDRKGKPMDAEIQVFALGGEFAIVSLPGEIFTELGMYIKSRSPYPFTMIVELANGSIDYIPDRKAFVEGNYETISSRCAPGSGEILAEHVLSILNELKNK